MERDRQHIALKAPAGSTGCELGVASGGLTVRFLDLGHFVEFHAVDKWDDAGHNIHEYDGVVDRLKDYEELTIWRQPAITWLEQIPDQSLGFVYIDCYAHTGQDEGSILQAAWPKLQVGGLFSGDDYDLFVGNKPFGWLTDSQSQLGDMSTCTMTTSSPGLLDLNTINQLHGTGISNSSGWWVTNDMGGTSITPPQINPVAGTMTLTKTGQGEFILQGNDAQRLLMEYFEQSPELWLRLMALKGDENADD